MCAVPSLIHALTKSNTAITITEMVTMGCVIDTKFIMATQSAAELYGYSLVDDLIGQWMSYRTHPDDLRVGRILSASRLLAAKSKEPSIDIPSDYRSRIRRHDGTYKLVWKHTTQFTLDGKEYWLTELDDTTIGPTAQEIMSAFYVTEDVQRLFDEHVSVAVNNENFQTMNLGLTEFTDFSNTIHHDVSKSREKCMSETIQSTTEEVLLVKATRDATGQLTCMRCGKSWVPHVPYPKLCPKGHPWDTPKKRAYTRRIVRRHEA